MSNDRDVTRAVRSWLREEAYEDADRVLFNVLEQLDTLPQHRGFWSVRSLFTRPSSMRLMAAAAVVVVVALGIAFTRKDVGTQLPSASPGASASPNAYVAPSNPPLPALSENFTSAIHGYSISYPAGWTVRPATEPWLTGSADRGDPAFEAENDHFASQENDTLVVTSQVIPDGTTFHDWLSGYVESLCPVRSMLCWVPSPSAWTPINIAGHRGLRWYAGYSVGADVVAVDGRAYVFRTQSRLLVMPDAIEGADPTRFIPPDLYLAMLATVQFDPASAVNAP